MKIFRGLKLAAARRKIAQLVEDQDSMPFEGKVTSLGIIIDQRNIFVLDSLLKLRDELSISHASVSVALFTDKGRAEQQQETIKFNWKNIDSKGGINKEDLEDFTVKGVDLLITFAAESNTAAHLVTAYCNAGIKVGRYQQNKALYDLILQTEEDVDLFVEELLKYLKRLKRIKNE